MFFNGIFRIKIDLIKTVKSGQLESKAEGVTKMSLKEEEKALEKLGAFEISFKMLSLAKNNEKQNLFLNAGRGNPNWIQTISRLAFARLVQFGVQESKRTIDKNDLAGYTEQEGIRERLETFLEPDTNKEDAFLEEAIQYAHTKLHIDEDELVKEWVDGVIGNNYPVPSRVLKNAEIIINHYLCSTLYHHTPKKECLTKQTQLFPTEGGTAAITYIFHSLRENHLIQAGDKIALNTPIFTPYIEIPELNDYRMIEIDVRSTEENHWQISADSIKQLEDPEIKAFFIVNPSNPGSMAFDDKALEAVAEAVKKNPNLMIITDDVYGTFVNQFRSVYSVAPHNTILVYSYSKLFGATGWRLGVIGMHEDNIFDQLIAQLPADEKKELHQRYQQVVLDPDHMKFIDRMVADSRSIGLYHTSGLSTPQQMMETLFSLAHLLNVEHDGQEMDHYIQEAKSIVATRYQNLHDGLSLKGNNSRHNAKYYSLIDIYELAETLYDAKFAQYLKTKFEQVDFLLELAKKNGVVLMDGVGFGSKPGVLRVSQANLPDEDYKMIAHQVIELLDEYHQEYEASQNK